MSANAFDPAQGLTAALSVTGTSTATPIQVKGKNNNATQRTFYNAGPNDCFIAGTALSADAVAVVPVAGTPSYGIPIPAGAVMTLSFPPNTYFAAITATGTATLYIVPGEGV
jgi:hypothetical protein